MAKIDSVVDAIESGLYNPSIVFGTQWVPDSEMETLHVRRKKAGESRHKLWYMSVTQEGQDAQTFWGHKMSDCLKKALTWRGLPVVNKRKKD